MTKSVNEKTKYIRLTPELSEDELKIFKEALSLSKGRTNNIFSAYLVQCGLAPKEIVKIASNIAIDGDTNVVSVNHTRKLTAVERRDRQQYARVPNFMDTIIARKNKIIAKIVLDGYKKEVSDYIKERNNIDKDYVPMSALNVTYQTYQNTHYDWDFHQIFKSRASMSMLFDFAEVFMNVEGIENLPEGFIADASKYSKKDWAAEYVGIGDIKIDYDKWAKYSVESLIHTDTPLDKIKPVLAIDEILSAQSSNFAKYIKDEDKIKAIIAINEFFEVCQKMGITLVKKKDESVWGAALQKSNMLLKQMLKAYSQYKRLTEREGFQMSVVREVIVKDLNQWIVEKCRVKSNHRDWWFIARNDIKDTPVDKVAVTVNKATRKNEIVEVDDIDEYIKKQNEKKGE